MKKLDNKYANFYNAVKRLNEANIEYKKYPDKLAYQDSLIKRFEFTYELAWKTLREFLIDQGYNLSITSPRGIIHFAYQENFLGSEQFWLDMLDARNLTSHDYGEDVSADVAEKISTRYCKELTELSKTIAKYLNK